MVDREETIQHGTCWPAKGKGESGDTSLTRYPGEVTIFDCNKLTRGNTCQITDGPCDLLPVFINPDGVVSCETAAGRLILDPDSGEFTGPYTSGTLSNAETKVLERLMKTPGETCMTEDIYRALNPEVNLSNFTPRTMKNTVTVRISLLRKTLGDEVTKLGQARTKPPIIETVNGGYRLVANRRRM